MNEETLVTVEPTSFRRSVLEMSSVEAHAFFLKSESYCGFDLPPYFEFGPLLTEINEYLIGKDLSSFRKHTPRSFDDVNHTILHNKDGRFAWRPFQLIHPALYISLVQAVTEESNWAVVVARFSLFSSNTKIQCCSLPVESESKQSDRAEQITQWIDAVERQSIELSLEYQYIAHSDITDCYGSIYTHSTAWALHGRSFIKQDYNRKDTKLIGNVIDCDLQNMSGGQTNGIPQGSVLMDFIAEMVLGYADLKLSEKLNELDISDYKILRYRDDYRIFSNHPTQAEQILKALSETLQLLGLKLNPTKTSVSSDVIRNAMKRDKSDWLSQSRFAKDIKTHFLNIHSFARDHPNSGSVARAISEFHRRLLKQKDCLHNAKVMIALAVDIAINSPRVYATISAIISKLLPSIEKPDDRVEILRQIQKRFERVPNTGHLQIWLQRFSHQHTTNIQFPEPLCQLVEGKTPTIWNSEWLDTGELTQMIDPQKTVNRKSLEELGPVINDEEVRLFEPRSL
jgi:RNA-directed DNA polymerase